VSASNIQADYEIIDNKAFVRVSANSVENFEFEIPYDYRDLEINSEYIIEGKDLSSKLIISSAKDLTISYNAESYIDKSGRKYFFVLRNPLDNDIDVKLSLPEGAVLDDSIGISPSSGEISSDGRKIIINWSEFNDGQILVSYEFLDDNTLYYLLIGVLAIILIVSYLWRNKKRPKEDLDGEGNIGEKDLLRNLFEDEKKIVRYLLDRENNESWTKEIIRELGISKVKLSRKVRSLEQKGLIKKIPYGNENIIRLLNKV
tara:strand:+ start:576 stop:1352 length:777 start_codon:yes stop_codon:yes gene_type:complete